MARALAHPRTRPAGRLLADRRLVGTLALATAVAAALRLPFLGTQSIWFDETYTINVVQAGSLGELWHRIGASESTPPLFYLLTWAWTHAIGSTGAAAVRTVSALAAVAAVPVAYLALRRLAGATAALATAALLTVSPLIGWYALDARAYGLLVLTALLSVWAFGTVLCDGASPHRLAPWALAAAAAIWTHWFAGFLVLAEVVVLLWLRPSAWRATALAAGAVLLSLLPLVGLLHEQTADARAAFIAGSGLANRLEQLVRQFGAGVNVPRTWLEAAALALALGGVALGTLLTARAAAPLPAGDAPPGEAHAPRDGSRALLGLAAIGLLVPLALAATGAYDRFDVRNVLFLWPLVAALAAPALLRLGGVPLAVLLALGIATSLWTQTDWRYGNSDWRAALARVEALDPHAPILAVTPLSAPVAALYLGRAPAEQVTAMHRTWVVAEPARSAGSRALRPVDSPLVARLIAAFPWHRELRVHAFRLIELGNAPGTVTTFDSAALPGTALFPAVRSGAG